MKRDQVNNIDYAYVSMCHATEKHMERILGFIRYTKDQANFRIILIWIIWLQKMHQNAFLIC